MKVAIFGAGIAGLTAAVALYADGHECRVYEPREVNLDAGIGFVLMPEAHEVFRALGLPFDAGQPFHRYLCRDAQGRVLQSHHLPPGMRCVRRRDVLQALRQALPSQALVLGQGGLGEFEFDAQQRVHRAWLDSGQAVEADVYVAADGVRSRGRTALFPHVKAAPARVFEVTGSIDGTCGVDGAVEDFNKFHGSGGGLAFGLLAVAPQSWVWFMQFDARRLPPVLPSAGPQAVLDFAASCVGGWAAPVPHIVAGTDPARVHLWRPVDMDPVPHFHRENLVLVGDAAHPLLPFSSQGVSAAMLDAFTLARAMREAPGLAQAFLQYSAVRQAACLPFVQQGRALTERFLQPGNDGVPLALA